jgi:hypothetical protein
MSNYKLNIYYDCEKRYDQNLYLFAFIDPIYITLPNPNNQISNIIQTIVTCIRGKYYWENKFNDDEYWMNIKFTSTNQEIYFNQSGKNIQRCRRNC